MLYERIYMGPDTDPVEIEPRPLVFEDVAAQATALLGDVGGELRSVGEVKTGQEFRLRAGDRLWIWRPMDTSKTDEEVSLGFFVTPLEALTLFMAIGLYRDEKIRNVLGELPEDEDERSLKLLHRLHEIVNEQFAGTSERKSMLQADTPHFEKVQTFERLPDEEKVAEG